MPKTEAIKPKILLWDIETSLMRVACFDLYPDRISHKHILDDWHIICGAWKWLGEKRVHTAICQPGGNDREAVQKLRDAVAEAHMVIGHNHDRFDLKKLRTRMVAHEIDPFPKALSIDTLKIAKREFGFTSNRLDYIGQFLGLGGKIDTSGEGLWLKVLQGDRQALRDMVRYNKRDVTLLEDVYLKLRPYDQHHPNLNVIRQSEKACKHCNADETMLQRRGWAYTKTMRYPRYQCTACGGWSQGRKGQSITVEVK